MKSLILIFAFWFMSCHADEAYWLDATPGMNIEKVKTTTFENTLSSKSLGYKKTNTWVKLSFDKISQGDILEVGYPLDKLTFYATSITGEDILQTSMERTKNHSRSHIFNLGNVDARKPLYLEIESKSAHAFPYKKLTYESYLKSTTISQFTLGLFYGVLLIAFILSIILLIVSREKLYFYFTSFLGCYLIFQLALNKEFPVLFNANSNFWLYHSISLFGGFTFFFSILYMKQLFSYKGKFISFAYWFCALISLVAATSWIWADYSISIKICMFTIGLSSIILLLSTVWILIKEKIDSQAFSFSLSWMPFYFLINSITLKTVGIIPTNFITNYAMQFASLLGVGVIYYQIYMKYKFSRLSEKEHDFLKRKSKIFSKIRHDIKSPLTALQYSFKQTKEKLDESSRVIANESIKRIQNIIDTMSTDYEEKQNEEKVLALLELARITALKQHEFKINSSVEITTHLSDDLTGLFINCDSTSLGRCISNLINNSVEAIAKNKIHIEVRSFLRNDRIVIEVSDNGKGIPKEQLDSITQLGFTYGKKNGSGVGLTQVSDFVKSCGGELSITSSPKGTAVSMIFDIGERPKWFADSITLTQNKKVVIVDDDHSIHYLWNDRLNNHIEKSFDNPIDFIAWLKIQPDIEKFLYLVDLEFLNWNHDGLDLIRETGIQNNSILVTSHFNEVDVQKKSMELNIKIIPKELASEIKILLPAEVLNDDVSLINESSEIILLDDDELIRRMWTSLASRKSIPLKTFKTVDELESSIANFSKNTIFYIDSSLSDHVKGETYSRKLFERGYRNIYLCTGYDASEFSNCDWLKGVIGKSPPWADLH